MNKLDENYLDLVRESLYKKQFQKFSKNSTVKSKKPIKFKHKLHDNEDSPKNSVPKGFKTGKEIFKGKAKLQKKLKKKIKRKGVIFIEDTNKNKFNSNPEEYQSNIKKRVLTPFKSADVPVKLENNSDKCHQFDLVSIIAKKVSPSLKESNKPTLFSSTNENDTDLLSKSKESRKRPLSDIDSTEITTKKKKNKPFSQKGIRLLFDDCPANSELDDCKIKYKSLQNKVIQHDNINNSELSSEVISNLGQKKKKIFKKKKVEDKPKEWDEELDTNATLNTSLEDETAQNLNSTWENFVTSLTNRKHVEKIRKKEMRFSKKPKNKSLKTDDNQTRKGQPVDNTTSDNLNDISNRLFENNLQVIVPSDKSGSQNKFKKKSDGINGKKGEITNQKLRKGLKISQNTTSITNGLNSSDSSEDFELKPKNPQNNSRGVIEDPAEVSDSCDNEKVGVKGLKFQMFCNMFPPTHNEQFLGQQNALSIPKKYFKISPTDLETEWQMEEVNSGCQIGSNNSDKTNSSSVPINHTPIPNNDLNIIRQNMKFFFSKNKKKINSQSITEKMQQEKVINILDMKILSPGSSGCIRSPKIQGTIQGNFITSSAFERNLNELKELDPRVGDKTDTSPCEESDKDIQDSLKNVNQPIIFHLKKGKKIVALDIGHEIYFHGLCLIKVLNGELDILGSSINSKSGERKFYSPRGTALLYVRNRYTSPIDGSVQLLSLIPENISYELDFERTFEKHYAIFLCSELKEPYIEFIERYVSQKIFPETNTVGPRVDFKLHGIWNRTKSSKKWQEVLEDIPANSKIVVSGGKGVGKSTFLRFAVNFLLRSFKKIRVIDLDPGQSEFYSPGCIYVVTVDKEVLGPNYTHLLKPDSLILSHLNIGYDIKKYLKSVKSLLKSTQNMEILPTLVNFPGFTQGLGLDVAAQSLKLIQPSLVIQINSKSYSKNYKIDLKANEVTRYLEEKNILSECDPDNVELSYDFAKFDSLSENNEAWSLEARQGREINILSYFGRMMSENIRYLPHVETNMYSISVSALSITDLEGKVISPLAINANLVALCSNLDEDSNLFACYGFGFVRGMDLQADTLVLLTPESIEALENVTHLILSSVTTPPSLIMTASSTRGRIPYVNEGELVDFGQLTKRSYLPPKK